MKPVLHKMFTVKNNFEFVIQTFTAFSKLVECETSPLYWLGHQARKYSTKEHVEMLVFMYVFL
jgi:hypothetical protein